MAIYRALHNLSGVAKRGELTALTHLTPAQLDKLIATGAIARVAAPPLAALPILSKAQVAKLKKAEVVTVEDFLECDTERIAELLRVDVEVATDLLAKMKDVLIVR